MNNRDQRRLIFENTQTIIRSGKWNVTYNYYDLGPQHYTSSPNYNTNVQIYPEDCLEVAQKLVHRGLNPAVLVNASPKRPGGGVKEGSSAQEEDLFRRTTLSYTMFQDSVLKAYPLPKDKTVGFVVGDVTVLKDKYYIECDRWSCGFIFAPAVIVPTLTPTSPPRIQDIHRVLKHMHFIFDMAYMSGYDSLVLGAWGCGVFKNPPQHIAELFKTTIETNYKGFFKEVHFAILDSRPEAHNPDGNLKPFQKVFGV